MWRKSGHRWNRIYRIATLAATITMGLLIAGILFFKLVPGFGFYIVKTGSMAPAINPGDVIFTVPPGNQVRPGEVITFQPENKVLVTHRVLSVENGQIQTRGDANQDPDGSRISLSQVMGRYLFKIPAIGQITALLHTRMGWFMIVIVPSILLVLWIVIEIIKEVFKATPAKAEVQPAAVSRNGRQLKGRKPTPSRWMPSPAAVAIVRKDLKYLLKDIY